MGFETRRSRSENLSGIKATRSRVAIKRLSVFGTLILALGVLAPSPAFASTTPCSSGGTFTIENNEVKAGSTCAGTATIPNTVTGVADFAFQNATGLAAIVFDSPSQVASFGNQAFYNTTALTQIDIPASVVTIAQMALRQSGVSNITFEAGSALQSIGAYAMKGTANLNSVTFPEGLVTIGYGAFIESALPTLNIPSTVTDVGGADGFYRTGFQNFFVHAANPNYSDVDGVLFDKSEETLVHFPETRNTTYSIPQGTLTIGTYSFYGSQLQSLVIPTTVTAIGDSGLDSAAISNLTFTSPSSVATIGDYAFAYLYSLSTIEIPASVHTIGEGAFDEASDVVFAPGSALREISDYAFRLADFAEFTIPPSVTAIGVGAFEDSSLTTIEIPASVISIGTMAFAGAGNLAELKFSETSSLVEIGNSAFYGTILQDVAIPASVKTIVSGAFSGVTTVRTLTFATGSLLEVIEQNAFFNTALSQVTLPATLTTLGNYAFRNASSLNSVKFLGDAPSVGRNVFLGIASEPTLTYQEGASGFEGSSDFDAFNLVIARAIPTAEPPTSAPVYAGPQLDAMQSATAGLEVGFIGRRLGSVTSAYAGSFPLEIVSASDGQLVLKIPVTVVGGSYDLVLDSAHGKLTFQSGLTVFDAPAEVTTSTSLQTLSVGSFKGFIAIYTKGYEGQRLSAKVAGKWLVIDSLNESFNGNSYSRLVRSTGAGYEILVHLYIDGQFVKTEKLTTR